ncbi:hypothetical protein QYE76_050030 [Lolium multiflorum]|uniref:Uncharacterized protein n=1 Tax=Lolium multiflorum TaxID=4521 RepID=A0AAD8WHF7_LOLMU|nr:hypothetical protein QYE76_050030 [Lolium multiflorum]
MEWDGSLVYDEWRTDELRLGLSFSRGRNEAGLRSQGSYKRVKRGCKSWDVTVTIWSRLLPEGCYLLELNHTRAIWAPMIFYRQSGEITTSTTEAFFESAAGARRLLFIKWCVPGDLKVTSGFDSSSKMERSSILLQFLGGDALRTSAIGGGGTQGPDCFFTFYMASPINFNQFLEKEKLKSNGSNFTDWFRHVRIFLNGGNLQYVLDAPLGDPPETETDEVKNVYATRKTRYSQVQCAILCSLESDLQKRFEHHDPHKLMKELKTIFETHAAVECYEASKHFFSCMMEEGSSIGEHMLVMTGHAKKLSDLGIEKGHWKRNCSKYLADLKSGLVKKKKEEMRNTFTIDTAGNTTTKRSEGKIFVAKNGTFLEKEFLTKEVTGRKVELDEIEESLLVDQSSAVPENVPVPPTPATEEANDNDHETSNETATEPRRSTRDRATPDWYDPCLNVMIVDNNDEDPATYEEAMMSPIPTNGKKP